MKILLAETDSLSHLNLLQLLQKSGHKVVVEASDKIEILGALQKVSPPQLVIIDGSIVKQNDSIISQIHTLDSPCLCHIIVLTTEDQKTEMLTELQIGTDDYLVKPFTAEEFQVRIALVSRLVGLQLKLQTLERYRDKNDLQDPEAALDILSDASFEAIFLSKRGICLNQNLTAYKMFGYTQEEAIGRAGTDWVIPAEREMATKNALKGDIVPYEATGLRKDGSTFPVEIQGRMVKSRGGYVRVTAMRDISRRREKVGERSEKRFRSIIEDISGVAIQGYDEKRKVIFWNLASEQLYGYSAKEALGQQLEDLIIPAEIRRDVIKLHQRWVDFGEDIPPGELTLRDKNGQDVPVYSSHIMLESSVGKEMFCIDIDLSPIKKVEDERSRLKALLHQKQKTEAFNTMAGGIAHDFNNILAIILSNIELIELTLPANISAQEPLQHIKQAISRARGTVEQLLYFSTPESDFERIELAPIVEESIQRLRISIPSTIDILKIIDSECRDLSIHASPIQIQQVLANLCNNAVYSMNDWGLLEISLKSVYLDAQALQSYEKRLPGNYFNLTVKDSGTGMSEDSLAKIFDPFFTTKTVGEGSGMGLSIVYGIIKNHAGFITVESVEGQGSTFQIYLPIIDKVETKLKTITSEQSSRGQERILIVDDEKLLVDAMEKMLSHHGFIVTAETSSIRALILFQTNPERFDLVITDQTMPGLLGTELIAEMLKIKPDLLTILCTGDSTEVSEAEAKKLGIKDVCLKPLSLSTLVQAAKKVLDNG